MLSNYPYLIVLLGDFNAQTGTWYDHGKLTLEELKIGGGTSQFELLQLIHDPFHILNNSSSCIDLIFESQPTFVVEDPGVNSSLDTKCH